MRITTKEQRRAVFNLFFRASTCDSKHHFTGSYADFRRAALPEFGSTRDKYSTIMVNWAGMWFGIEPDGYTHT